MSFPHWQATVIDEERVFTEGEVFGLLDYEGRSRYRTYASAAIIALGGRPA